MNTNLLNENALRALKRAEIQQLAKTLDIIDALVSRHPDGVEPLRKEQGPVRRSKRLDITEPKEEEAEEEVEIQPAIYGESISQYRPPRLRKKPKVVVEEDVSDEEDEETVRRQLEPHHHIAAAAAAATVAATAPLTSLSKTCARRATLQRLGPNPCLGLFKGHQDSLEPKHRCSSTSGNTSCQGPLGGHGPVRDKPQPLGTEWEHDLSPNYVPPDSAADAGPTRSYFLPGRRPQLSPLRISPLFHLRPAPANPRPRLYQSTPRNVELPPRPPVFTRPPPPPPPAQPEAGPSKLPAQAGPSHRRAPSWSQLPEEGSDNPFFVRRTPTPEPSPFPTGALGPYIHKQPVVPRSPVPQLQPVAGPSRLRLDPHDGRFRLPETPEHVRRERREPFVALSDEEVAVRQPRHSVSRPQRVPPPAEMTSSEDQENDENDEAAAQVTFAPVPAAQAGPSGHPSNAADDEDEPTSPLGDVYNAFLAFAAQDEPPEPVNGIELKKRAYATLHSEVIDRLDDDVESDKSEDEEDVEDARLAELQKQVKAVYDAAVVAAFAADGEPPVRTKGMNKTIALKLRDEARAAVQKLRGLKAKRKQLNEMIDFLKAQSKLVAEWVIEMHAKRIVTERLIAELKDPASGWLQGKWRPSLVQMMQAAGELLPDEYDESALYWDEIPSSVEEPQRPGPPVDIDDTEFFCTEDFEPPNFSLSPLPPSSPPISDSLPAIEQSPEPVTPPRRTRGAVPRRRKPDSDELDGESFESPDSGRRPKAFHPSKMVDEAERGPTASFALRPARFTPKSGRPSFVAEYGSSISQFKKRRRGDDEDDAENEASSDSGRESDSEGSEHSAISQPTAGPSQPRGYVPKPVPGYNGFEGDDSEPDYPWGGSYDERDIYRVIGRRESLFPSPKRARRS
ncbi:uncharacterized protein B0H18DRAFT_1122267 [Fomitopsis serialis]|uniref:uncharacterized protein n=1 Tax=Fomitopsis serialis TaxID=139415 RepID=UPI002007BC6B|nr:uncharacterized protein B0H18DRAFT_1122267 [Neoantrodia serialis]KAH9919827.1 hypothetical protein B0H18DRAFT_1122267 [Neoantrodia serialis]